MAATTKLILVRPSSHLKTFRLFSSSSSSTPIPPPDSDDKPPEPNSKSQFSSYFSDAKAALKQSQQMNPSFRLATPRPITFPPPNSSMSPPTKQSFEEIGKTLSGFRHRTVPSTPGPQPPSSSTQISFQDIFLKNVNSASQGSSLNYEKSGTDTKFSTIRESLKQIKLTTDKNPRLKKSISDYQKSSNLGGIGSNIVTGKTDSLPIAVFGKEMGHAEENQALTTQFVKYYSVKELGEKLKSLRPEKKGDMKDWFSLNELNERLVKLRQMEMEMEKEKEKEMDKGNGSTKQFTDLRHALTKIKFADAEKAKKDSMMRLESRDILSQHGRTPSFMMAPPKEELVVKYFHPDNMSASEKLKLELQKIRDEFKMSETDCGSARVQVAQLTIKINHLAGILHKKDKHSRKGLQGMLQKRKSMLKYLRRTDWESYSFVLSRLGLRDNPVGKR